MVSLTVPILSYFTLHLYIIKFWIFSPHFAGLREGISHFFLNRNQQLFIWKKSCNLGAWYWGLILCSVSYLIFFHRKKTQFPALWLQVLLLVSTVGLFPKKSHFIFDWALFLEWIDIVSSCLMWTDLPIFMLLDEGYWLFFVAHLTWFEFFLKPQWLQRLMKMSQITSLSMAFCQPYYAASPAILRKNNSTICLFFSLTIIDMLFMSPSISMCWCVHVGILLRESLILLRFQGKE